MRAQVAFIISAARWLREWQKLGLTAGLVFNRQHHGQTLTQAISALGAGDFFHAENDISRYVQHGVAVTRIAQLVSELVGQLRIFTDKHALANVKQKHARGGQRAFTFKII